MTLTGRQKRRRGCRYRDYDNPALRLFTLPLEPGAGGKETSSNTPRRWCALIDVPIMRNYKRKQFVG